MIKRRTISTISRAVALAVAATLLAACGDTTAPEGAPAAPSDATAPSFVIAGTAVPLTAIGDTTYAAFVVKPEETRTFVFDRHSAITFPQNAICKNTGGYGPTLWNAPCQSTTRAVRVTVKSYKGADGHVITEFHPAIRFNPATAGVFLYLEDYPGAVPLWGETILYCNDARVCTDESLTDSSLKTFRDPVTGLYGRRIKHFSGYMIGVGRDELGL